MNHIPNINKTRISVVTKPTNVSVSTAGVRGREQDLSNYAVLNGGNTFNQNQTISGSLFVSGSSEFGGDLVPIFARGATLGTQLRPFKGIFVSSGSINIASDVIGDPNTTISNVGGNLLISAGGIRLIGDASFIAATGSFQYLSGSFTHIGLQFNEGDIVTTGSLKVSGSTIQIGNNTQIGNNILSGSTTQIGNNILTGTTSLTGSVNISGSTTIVGTTNFSNSSTTVSGSFLVSGSTIQIGNNTLDGNTSLEGTLYVSGSQEFVGTSIFLGNSQLTGSWGVSGSTVQIGNNTLLGNTLLSGSIGVNGVFSFDNINTDNTATQVLVWNEITHRVGKQSGASNLDGGAAASVYLSVSEELNGGGA